MCGLCTAGVIAGGAGPRWAAQHAAPGATEPSEALRQPDVLHSADGSLTVRLEVTAGVTSVAGRPADLLRYNGEVPGPTLALHPGDRLAVELVNSSEQPTNLHTHGLAVSPMGNGDNPFAVVDPGQTFRYDFKIPTDQPAGTCWYHPHHHGVAADQILRGLYGAIVIEDAADDRANGDGRSPSPIPQSPIPQSPIRQRVLVISDITLDEAGNVPPANALQRRIGREGNVLLVNGQVRPVITAAPGASERWHLVNACVSRFLRLRLDGQRLDLIGIDLPLGAPRLVDEIVLMPGNRADVIVTARAGTSVLQAIPVDRIAAGMSFGGMGGGDTGNRGVGSGPGSGAASSGAATGPVDLAALVVDGPPVGTGAPGHPTATVPDLRAEPLTAHRTITLAMGMEMQGPVGMSFTIDGHRFDPARVDQRVSAGALEQWTIVNTSELDHPFHLHIWPMQVVRVGDVAAEGPTWQNVVNVPARSSTIVLIRFGPVTGRTVFHCHILDHADAGMMGVVEVR